MNPLYNGIYICRLRLAIALTSIVAFVVCKCFCTNAVSCVACEMGLALVFALIARQERNAARGTADIDIFHWKKTDPVSVALFSLRVRCSDLGLCVACGERGCRVGARYSA